MEVIFWCIFGLVLFGILGALFGEEDNSYENLYNRPSYFTRIKTKIFGAPFVEEPYHYHHHYHSSVQLSNKAAKEQYRETRRERRNRNRRLDRQNSHQRRLESFNRSNSRAPENEDIHCHVLIDREEKAALILMHRENSNEAALILMCQENSNNFRQNGMKEITYRK